MRNIRLSETQHAARRFDGGCSQSPPTLHVAETAEFPSRQSFLTRSEGRCLSTKFSQEKDTFCVGSTSEFSCSVLKHPCKAQMLHAPLRAGRAVGCNSQPVPTCFFFSKSGKVKGSPHTANPQSLYKHTRPTPHAANSHGAQKRRPGKARIEQYAPPVSLRRRKPRGGRQQMRIRR